MEWVTERFELNPSTTGITAVDGNGATWNADIWDFKVPFNTQIELNPTDIFAAYLIGDDAAEMPGATQVRVVVRDVASESALPILRDTLYQRVKAFSDVKKLTKLPIDKMVTVETDEHIVVMVNGADAAGSGDTDASASHFRLVTTRKRKPLGR